MNVPCQAAHWYIIPAIGARLTAELKRGGMSQREIARSLRVSEAAVSHYAKGRRGAELRFDRKTERGIGELARRICGKRVGYDAILRGVCELCTSARRSRSVCRIHMKGWKIGKCTVCFGGEHGCF